MYACMYVCVCVQCFRHLCRRRPRRGAVPGAAAQWHRGTGAQGHRGGIDEKLKFVLVCLCPRSPA